VAQNVNPTFVKTPNNGLVQISTGTGTANVTIYTGAANGSKVIALNATNQSSGTANIRFAITNGITTYIIGEANIPLSAGFVGGENNERQQGQRKPVHQWLSRSRAIRSPS